MHLGTNKIPDKSSNPCQLRSPIFQDEVREYLLNMLTSPPATFAVPNHPPSVEVTGSVKKAPIGRPRKKSLQEGGTPSPSTKARKEKKREFSISLPAG